MIKHREDIQNLNELISLESQVKAVRLQDRLGKQKFHEDMKKYLNLSLNLLKILLKV